MADKIVLPDVPELAPEPPPRGPIVWARQNLFSTPSSIVLTLIGAAIAWFGIRGMAGFILADERKWQAITTNFRLLMVQAYPDEHLWRIWVSVGIIAVLLGLSLALWRAGGRTSPRAVLRSVQYLGGAIAAVTLIAPASIESQLVAVAIGAALIGVPYLATRALGDRAKKDSLSTLVIAAVIGAAVLAFFWIIQVPVPIPDGGVGAKTLENISRTTLGPWTLLYFATIAAYFLGVGLRSVVSAKSVRPFMVTMWALSFPVIVLHLTRATSFENIGAESAAQPEGGLTISGYLLIGLVFAAVGGAFIWFVANPRLGEWGRGLAGIGLVLAVGSWLVAMPMVVRLLLLALAAFALAGPTFAGGERRATIRYVSIWVASVVVAVYLMLLAVGETTVVTPNETPFGGFYLTWILAIAGIALSFPIGVVMALARTSTMPIFRLMSTVYIEVVRGVPLITWLLVSIVVFPILFPQDVTFVAPAKVTLFIAFFSGAYLAENVRGGLQSISKGQNEAANALGMTTLQRTVFITLPQALRAVIPALVGQVIAIFKDTSLVAIVGLFDILNIGRNVIPNQSGAGDAAFNFLQTQREGLIAVAVMYWIFTFTFSRVSQRIEKRLGVGTR
jgi:general L-amino acid transport system permease protein